MNRVLRYLAQTRWDWAIGNGFVLSSLSPFLTVFVLVEEGGVDHAVYFGLALFWLLLLTGWIKLAIHNSRNREES